METHSRALRDYIRTNDYNPAINAYIESVNWLTDWNASPAYAECLYRIEATETMTELEETVEKIADCDEITHREYAALYAVAVIHSRCCE